MEAVVDTANYLHRTRLGRNGGPVGAEEPHLVLASGDVASYALIARVGSSFNVDRIYDKGDLDRRPTFQGQGRMDRHMVVCEGTWQGRKLNIGLCHCPASRKYSWDEGARQAVLPEILKAVGAREGGSGAGEPTAWILGGDLNCGEHYLSNLLQHYQPTHRNVTGAGGEVQQIMSHTEAKVRHGDIALAQHLEAYQVETTVVKTFSGVSDNHDLVVVPIVLHGT